MFLWLVLGPQADWWAVGLLIAAAASDWLDGKIARAWNQESRLGQVLDPAADRLYIAATLTALAVRGLIPWWLVAVLVARELVLGVALLVLRGPSVRPAPGQLRRQGRHPVPAVRVPAAVPRRSRGRPATVARVIGWAFAIWGTALYWWAAGLYLAQARQLATAAAAAESPGAAGPASTGPS